MSTREKVHIGVIVGAIAFGVSYLLSALQGESRAWWGLAITILLVTSQVLALFRFRRAQRDRDD